MKIDPRVCIPFGFHIQRQLEVLEFVARYLPLIKQMGPGAFGCQCAIDDLPGRRIFGRLPAVQGLAVEQNCPSLLRVLDCKPGRGDGYDSGEDNGGYKFGIVHVTDCFRIRDSRRPNHRAESERKWQLCFAENRVQLTRASPYDHTPRPFIRKNTD